LEKEVELRKKNFFPHECIKMKEDELNIERKKFECMIEKTVQLQAMLKDDNSPFGNISIEIDREFPPQTPSGLSKISGIEGCDYIDNILANAESFEQERSQLKDCVLSKEKSLTRLEDQLKDMYEKMEALINENKTLTKKLESSEKSGEDSVQLQQIFHNSQALAKDIKNMEKYLALLRDELNTAKASSETDIKRTIQHGDCDKKLKKLDCSYKNLLQKYCSKNEECNEITKRLHNVLKTMENNTDQAENEMLKSQAERLMQEIEDYQNMIQELQYQVSLYRDKFLKAQERVEEQKLALETLTTTNKNIEDQVNCEILKIKEKFQHKLSELCPYPKMYEESKLELDESKERIETLQKDLKATINALCKAKCELDTLKSQQPDESIKAKYDKLSCEMDSFKRKYCSLSETKKCLEEKLAQMRKELEKMRCESSKIITTTKCCAEKNRQILHEQINCLEQKLAECQAKSSVSLAEKEEVIKKLKQELTMLCGHFASCQDQIKSLKNQLEYLQDQRYKTNAASNSCCYKS
jgi:chromosome segregation ATPase